MAENSVNPIRTQPQTFTKTGVTLSSLKGNELLFNFFKSKGFKEDAIIYSSDIDKLTKDFDKDNDGISVKEARAMGLEGSRKEIKNAIKIMNTIHQTELAAVVGNYPVVISENETEFHNNDGKLQYNIRKNDDDSTETTYFVNGDKTQVDKTIVESKNRKVTTEFNNGNTEQPANKTIVENGEETKIKYNWFNEKLNSQTTTKGNEIEDIVYKQINGEAIPERIINSFKSDPNSVQSVFNELDSNGKIIGQTIQYEGAKIKGGVIQEDTVIDPATQKTLSKTVTFSDNTKEHFVNISDEMKRVGIDSNGMPFVTFNVPEGWSVKQIADTFGIKTEDLLNANTAENGKKAFKTNSKGVAFFLINQSVKIPNPSKLPEGLEVQYNETNFLNKNGVIKTTVPEEKLKEVAPDTLPLRDNPEIRNNGENPDEIPAKTNPEKEVQETDPTEIAQQNNNAELEKTKKEALNKKQVAANNGKMPYIGKNNHVQAPIDSWDAKTIVKRARTHGGVGRKLNYNNINNTLRRFYNRGTSFTTIMLRQYTQAQQNKDTAKKFSDKELIENLKFVKDNIELARQRGQEIPKKLYQYKPRQGNTPEQTKKEAQLYEQVFGKGSSGVQV